MVPHRRHRGVRCTDIGAVEVGEIGVNPGYQPCLVWRQEGASVRFAAAFLPLGKGETGNVEIESIPVVDEGGTTVGLESGQGVHVRSGDDVVTVLVNYCGRPLTAGCVSGIERVAVHIGKVQHP